MELMIEKSIYIYTAAVGHGVLMGSVVGILYAALLVIRKGA